jgi:hypothetical protein
VPHVSPFLRDVGNSIRSSHARALDSHRSSLTAALPKGMNHETRIH